MKLLIILVCAIALVRSQNGNDIVEKIIKALKSDKNISNGIDPAYLGDYESDNFKATNLMVEGLMSMERVGNSNWTIDDDYKNMYLDANLKATDLIIKLDYKYKWLLITFSGIMRIKVDELMAEIILTSAFRPIQPKLKLFEINGVNGLKIAELTGFRPINWFMKFVMERMVKRLLPRIKSIVNEKVSKIINDNLSLLTEVVKSVM